MSTTTPTPPLPSNPNKASHYIDDSQFITKNIKNENEESQRRKWSSQYLKKQQSSKIVTTEGQSKKKSFIWDWLEGKLENKNKNFSDYKGSSSSSSPMVDIRRPLLTPKPMDVAQGTNDLVGLYDPTSNMTSYMNFNEYVNLFGISLEDKTKKKEEKLVDDEEKEVEETKEKSVKTYVRRSKMKSQVKNIKIGAIDVQVPLKTSSSLSIEGENVNEIKVNEHA
ncbi:hypothetical protein M9H77_33463 [Catharanthus roseus]|uniref:Uncharacterized protein n=1 Tax=Catharanthus roseus TaxID=4058 RepID=A0ACB9ZJ86_CATRO|nr:hypothetical protein M9H77_33463 [Catharanthus roseus]